jgi:hypothetical protein
MANRVMISSVICGTAIAALISVNVQAQSVTDAQLAACATIENPLQRLVCFDQLTAGEKPTVAQRKANPEDRFGREHKEVTQGAPDKIFVDIVAKSKDVYGFWVIELSNGQRWRQTEAGTYQLPDGADYYIERGVLDSFFLGRKDINRRIRVQRIDE